MASPQFRQKRRQKPAAQWDVVVIGGANTDYMVRGPRLPEPGETVQGDTFFQFDGGGKGANQAVAAARLGARVAFIGRVGADARGRALLRQLRTEGVDTRHVSIDPRAPTGAALIMVDPEGEKQIAAAPGANVLFSVRQLRRAADYLKGARAVVLQFEISMQVNLVAAQLAHRAGVPVILDPAPAARPPKQLLRLLTLIRPNASEARALTDVDVKDRNSARLAAEQLLGYGIGAAVIQGGSEGNLLVWGAGNDRGGELWLPRIPVKSIDATGAGDAFVGAVAVGLAEGRSLPETTAFANAAAALATTKFGAQPALPERKAVLALLRRTGWPQEARSFARNGSSSRENRP